MDPTRYIPGQGNFNAKLLFVGEAPSYAELEQGRPFVGPAGRIFDTLLRDCGINRANVWTTNVSKYFVPFPAKKGRKIPFHIRAKTAGINMEQQVEELWNEIRGVGPNCVVALGGSALWALRGTYDIQDYRGSILSAGGIKCVPTYHPAFLIHSEGSETIGYWNKLIMMLDLKRALHQSTFKEFKLPARTLNICTNSQQLLEFIARGKEYYARKSKRIKCSVDIEALNCIPACIGLAFTEYEGLTIPLWNTGDISSIPTGDLVNIWKILTYLFLDESIDFVGQNFKYDQDKIERLGFRFWHIRHDVMLKSHAINPELPKNLAFNTSIYTEEPFYKNEGMYEGSLNDLFIGCARDACVTLEIDNKMDAELEEIGQKDFYDNFLMKLHPLYLDIERVGFKVNEKRREELLRKYIAWDEGLGYEMYQLVGHDVNVNSWQQVGKLLFEELNLPVRSGTGEEELTALLNIQAMAKKDKERRAIEIVLTRRRVKKTISTYIMAEPDYDGRMRTTYYICLETGRTSTGQQDPPIRPTVEYRDSDGKKKKKSMGTAFQTMTKHGDIGADVRSMYEADEGEVFIQADSSQAEARVVALLANDDAMLRMYNENDVHALTASWFVGGTEADWSKKKLGYEHPNRFLGKTLRHAGHLGASKRRATTEVNTQARKYNIKDANGNTFKISEGFADTALKIFHAKNPKIKSEFHAGVVNALEKNRRVLIAPLPFGIESRYGGRRTFYERWGDELFRVAYSYIPQRAVSDNTKAAALRVKARASWIRIILESHDALLVSVPETRKTEAGLVLKEEMERPIDFSNCSLPRGQLVIPCELEIGYNYQELDKFKLETAT